MTRTCVIPGSFDPLTLGHLDIFERAAAMFDRAVVGVLRNAQKKPLFSVEERIKLIEKSTRHLPNLEARGFEGLTVDFAREMEASAILRGLRMVSDFDYEQQLTALNRLMAPEIDTLFLMTDNRYGFLSSSMVREIGSLRGDISGMVPEAALADILRAFGG